MLKIKNLCFNIGNKPIFNNFNLDIKEGEIHAIMGSNGVGKSTLSKIIMRHPNYLDYQGSISFNNVDLKKLVTDQVAKLDIYLVFQSPTEIKGVNNFDFLRASYNSFYQDNDMFSFMNKLDDYMSDLKISDDYLDREVNVSLSGGEKKKSEVLGLNLLKPKFIILDELDSGLDIDNLKVVTDNLYKYKEENKEVSLLIITHYPKILKTLKPDYVHVIKDGKIIKTGSYQLAEKIEKKGYNE